MKQELRMETMNNKDILSKYKGQLCGSRNSNIKPNYYVDDFVNPDELIEFIISTYDHESSFTKIGFDFIERYYGLDKVIEMVLSKYPNYPFDDGVTPKEALLVKKEFALDSNE